MADEQKTPNNKSLNSSSKEKVSSGEIGSKGGSSSSSSSSFSDQKPHNYPNQREASIPDAATLRDQWRFAIRQYSKWYSHAWGTAILAGVSFFALGWIIKGSNPLPSRKQEEHDHHHHHHHHPNSNPDDHK